MSSSIYLAVPLMLLLTVAQTAVLPRFPLLGLIPQLPFLVALAWGLLRGIEEGVVWAFVAGFCLDLFSIGPMGLTALTFMTAVLTVTWIEQNFPQNRFFMPVIVAILGTLIYLFLYLFLLRLLGYQSNLLAAASLPPVAILHGALILPVYWLMYFLDRRFRPRRVEI